MSNKTRFSLMVNFIEKYIRELKWSGDETDQERTLAAGNIRAFAGAVCKFLQPDYDRIEELEAENRIFRDTGSVDDSVWDALLEQVRLHQERIRELETAVGMCRCADEVRCAMRKLITDCDPYLKDGETPAECIQRNRDDTGAVLKLLAKEKRKHTALLEKVEGVTARLEATEWYKRDEWTLADLRAIIEQEKSDE